MSSKLRRFHGEPVTRLIVSVAAADVARVDELIVHRATRWPGNRAEFVRQAIAEKLARDLMARAKADSERPT